MKGLTKEYTLHFRMSTYPHGDFSFITESLIVYLSLDKFIFMLKELYDTISQMEKWDLFEKYPGVFSSELYEELTEIHNSLLTGHSSFTFTYSLKHMECIYQYGWEYYVNSILQNIKDVKEKRDTTLDAP